MTTVLPEPRGVPSGLVLDGELVAWRGSVPYFPQVCRRVLNRDMSVPLTPEAQSCWESATPRPCLILALLRMWLVGSTPLFICMPGRLICMRLPAFLEADFREELVHPG